MADEKAIDLGADDGYAEITMAGATVRIDVWECDARRSTMAADLAGKPANEFNAAAVDFIESLGFPRVSHRMASRFLETLYELAKGLEKKADPAPGSPDSTASTAGTGPPGE